MTNPTKSLAKFIAEQQAAESTKEDFLQRFLFAKADCRGAICSLPDSFNEVLRNAHYPLAIKQQLGQFLAAAALLTTGIKLEGKIIIQARGDGPLKLIMAEATHNHELRAIAHFENEADSSDLARGDLSELIGNGNLSIIIDPDQGQRYQGIVPLESPTLAACLEDYFLMSEQLPSRFWLEVGPINEQGTLSCAGFMLQMLPTQLLSTAANHNYWQHVTTLAESMTAKELIALPVGKLIHRLYHQDSVMVYPPSSPKFSCSCSRERTMNALLFMGEEEVADIIAEKGEVEVVCQICNAEYHFSPSQVDEIFNPQIPRIH